MALLPGRNDLSFVPPLQLPEAHSRELTDLSAAKLNFTGIALGTAAQSCQPHTATIVPQPVAGSCSNRRFAYRQHPTGGLERPGRSVARPTTQPGEFLLARIAERICRGVEREEGFRFCNVAANPGRYGTLIGNIRLVAPYANASGGESIKQP